MAKRSGNSLMDAVLAFNVTVEGANKASTDLDKVEKAAGQAAKATDLHTRKGRRGVQAMLELSRGAEDFASQIGTQGLAGGLRASANNLSQFATILSPMAGVLVGIGAAASTILLPKLFESSKKKAEEFKEELKGLTDELDALERATKRVADAQLAQIKNGQRIRDLVDKGDVPGIKQGKKGGFDEIAIAKAGLRQNRFARDQILDTVAKKFLQPQNVADLFFGRNAGESKKDFNLRREREKKSRKTVENVLERIGRLAPETEKSRFLVGRQNRIERGRAALAKAQQTGNFKGIEAVLENSLRDTVFKDLNDRLQKNTRQFEDLNATIEKARDKILDFNAAIPDAEMKKFKMDFDKAALDLAKIVQKANDEAQKANAKAAKKFADDWDKIQNDLQKEVQRANDETAREEARFRKNAPKDILNRRLSILRRQGDGSVAGIGPAAALKGSSEAFKGILESIKAARDADDPVAREMKQIEKKILEIDKRALRELEDIAKSLGVTI